MEFKIDESIGFIIARTNAKFKNALFQKFRKYDVTPEQWIVLNKLWQNDGIPQKELSDRSFKDQPNTTRILDKLERKGYIRRAKNKGDRRSSLVYLTDEGKQLKEILIPITLKVIEEAVAGFNEEEINLLKRSLNKIYGNLLS